VGDFDVPGEVARKWLIAPTNPNGKPNSDVVRPWINGQDVVRRPSDTWIIDFHEVPEAIAALYVEPFAFVVKNVKPTRDTNRRERRKLRW